MTAVKQRMMILIFVCLAIFAPAGAAYSAEPAAALAKPAAAEKAEKAEKLVTKFFFTTFDGFERDNLYVDGSQGWWQTGAEKVLKKGSRVSASVTTVDNVNFFMNADGYGRTRVKAVTVLYFERIKSLSKGLAKGSVLELNNGLKWKVTDSADALEHGKTAAAGERVTMTYDSDAKCNRLFAADDTWQVELELYNGR